MKSFLIVLSLLASFQSFASGRTLYLTDSDAERVNHSLAASLRNAGYTGQYVMAQMVKCTAYTDFEAKDVCVLFDSNNARRVLNANDSLVLFRALHDLKYQPYGEPSSPLLARTSVNGGISISTEFLSCAHRNQSRNSFACSVKY